MPDNANNSPAATHALCAANAQHISNPESASNAEPTGHYPTARPEKSHPVQSNMNSNEQARVQKQKIFIIGLPRTGTTSVSVALLELGFKVAHMAFTQESFMQADAVSDAPCFSDYRQLDTLFEGAKFIYLDRALEEWVPSMQMLLGKMLPHLDEKTGRFHPILKRSFNHVFSLSTAPSPIDIDHLSDCYQRHKIQVHAYFAGRDDFLSINISHQDSFATMVAFLGITPQQTAEEAQVSQSTAACAHSGIRMDNQTSDRQFPRLNIGRNVASWDEYKHPNKISSNAQGPARRRFFDYKLDTDFV